MKKLGVVLAAGAMGTALLATGCGSNAATNARRATNNVRHTVDGYYYNYGYGANPDGTYYGTGYNDTGYSRVGNGMVASMNKNNTNDNTNTNNSNSTTTKSTTSNTTTKNNTNTPAKTGSTNNK